MKRPKKIEIAKQLLVSAAKYGFDTTNNNLFTKSGNLKYPTNITYSTAGVMPVKASGCHIECNGSTAATMWYGHEDIDYDYCFAIALNSSVKVPFINSTYSLGRIQNFSVTEAQIYCWEFESLDEVDRLVKECAEKIELFKLKVKEHENNLRENEIKKDF